MPKDDRVIHRAIRMPGNTDGKKFAKGAVVTDPDELMKLAGEKKVDLQALHDSGVISGTWKGVKTKSQEA